MKLMKCLDEIGQHFPVAEPCGDPTHAHHTYSVDVMHAGELVNQIPDAAEAHIDIRITPGTTLDEISQIVRDTVSKYASVTVAPLMESSPATVDTKDPKLQLLHQLISRATGTTPELTLSHGQSDSSYFRAIGVTVLMFGPPGGGHHSGHEWIDAQGVEQFHDILHEFIEAVAQTEKPAAK
jgi:succinyl-diaminopimelate desuccinylase